VPEPSSWTPSSRPWSSPTTAAQTRPSPALAGRRIVVQATELEAAHAENYTFPALIDFDGAIYDRTDGEAEIADGLVVLPTPGHSPGHQPLIVCARDGTLFVAGQPMDFSTTAPGPVGSCASAYASAHLARRATHELGRPLAPWPDWLDRIEQFDPARVVFAHDDAIFEPDIPSRARSWRSPQDDPWARNAVPTVRPERMDSPGNGVRLLAT